MSDTWRLGELASELKAYKERVMKTDWTELKQKEAGRNPRKQSKDSGKKHTFPSSWVVGGFDNLSD